MEWMQDFRDAYDAQDLEAIMDAFADDAVASVIGNAPVFGKAAIREWFSVLLNFAKGVEHSIVNLWYVDDSTCVCEFIGTGRRPGGERFELPGVSVTERIDAKIVSFRTYTDPRPQACLRP